VKRLAESARDAGLESTLEKICPFISRIADDNEMVIRQALASQLAELSAFLISKVSRVLWLPFFLVCILNYFRFYLCRMTKTIPVTMQQSTA
jgi:hypothetical protein